VGISSISAQGSINVAVSRTNYEVLEDAVCVLTVTSRESDFKTEVLVDFASSQFSPNVRIDPQNLDDKEQLDATIACNSPFDIDDDPSDDTDSILFEKDEASALQSSSVIWGSSVAILLIVIYLFIIQRQDNAMIREMVRDQTSDKPKQTRATTTEAVVRTQDSTDLEEEEKSTLVQSEEDDSSPPPSLIEEIPAEDDLTPSGRLDSIRKEMNPDDNDEEQSSIEERMSKFFK